MRPFNYELSQFEKYDVVLVNDTYLAVVTQDEIVSKTFYQDDVREIVIQYVEGPKKGHREFINTTKVKSSQMSFYNIIATDFLTDKLIKDTSGTFKDPNNPENGSYQPYQLSNYALNKNN